MRSQRRSENDMHGSERSRRSRPGCATGRVAQQRGQFALWDVINVDVHAHSGHLVSEPKSYLPETTAAWAQRAQRPASSSSACGALPLAMTLHPSCPPWLRIHAAQVRTGTRVGGCRRRGGRAHRAGTSPHRSQE